MVEITNASNLMPSSITVVEDGTTIEITTTPLDVSVNSGVVTIQTGGITSVNGDAGPVVVLDTDDISEGVTNQYYTTARANTDFDTRLATKTTTDLIEGTNLYYTDARVNTLLGTKGYATETYVDTEIANLVDSAPVTLDTLNELAAALGDDPNFATTTATALGTKLENINNESISDLSDVNVATSVANGDLLHWNSTVNLWQNFSPTTDDFPEGSTLYYTDARARNAISATGDINYNSTTGVISYTTPTSLDWTAITNTPTTISGYGITDAYDSQDFDTDFGLRTTSSLNEGINLYYTNQRATGAARNAISVTGDLTYNNVTGVISYTTPSIPSDVSDLTDTTGLLERDDLSNNTTSDLAEGTNLYYTDARADARVNLQTGVNLDLSSKTTTDLAEGINLYYTDARAQAVSINALSEDLTPQLSADLDANNNYIVNLLDPINNQDAATKLYVDSSIAGASVTSSTATILEVRNTTGTPIAKGVPVYISGHSGTKILVAPADADDPTKMPAIGLMNATLSNNSDGEVISFGLIVGIDLSTFSIGDTLYVDTTPGGSTFGGLTNTPPTGETSAIQNIGKVARNVSNGEFIVSGPGRSNATPNLDNDQFFLGNASNQAVATDFSTAVEAISINNVVEDTTPQLGGDLDVNNFSILNNGSNPYFVLGNDGNLFSTTHALGAYRSSSITGFTGATRAWFNGDISKTTLGGNVSVSNGRIVNNYAATTLDLNSYSLTSTGITRGLHTWLANSPTIQNTGAASVSLAQNRNIMVQGMFLEGSNITVDESSSVYINQFYEGDDGTGTITNAYGLYINDAGTSGATVTNKYSIYSNGANNPMYHAGPVTIGAFTLPNTDGSAGQVLTTDGLGNVTWTTVSGGGAYGDADVDLHLNTSTAATGEVLSWNGVDYDWVAQGGGGGSFTGDLLGATLQDSTNSSIAMSDVIHISSDATHNTKPAAIRISENEYIDGPSILIQKANGFDIDAGYLQVQKRTQAVTGSYPRLVHIFDALDVAPGSTTTPTQSMNQQIRRVYYNNYYSAWENWQQTVYEFGLDGSFNINGGNGYVGTSNQKMNWGVPMDFQMNGTAGFANSTGSTAVFSILTGANAITNSVNIEIRTDATGPTQFNAIDDQAWLNTGVGVYNSRIDPFWSYGTNWLMTMRFTMPSWATQTSVTVDKAFPPFGQIVSQWGFIYPSYANVPTWANTNTRQITMTRPASGRNLYEYKFECINGSLFVRDWRLDNIA